MPFQPITNSEIATGAIIDTDLLGKVKNDFDVHEESIGTLNVQTAALASAPSPVIIGTIVHSMLTLTQYQSLAGSGWALADGGSCVGTAYGALTGFTTLPDLRGKYLRGKGYGSGNNPDGDLALGTYQADQNKSHTHTQNAHSHPLSSDPSRPNVILNQYQYSGGGYAVLNAAGSQFFLRTDTGVATAVNQNDGGNETRPKSVTVNIFIKVN